MTVKARPDVNGFMDVFVYGTLTEPPRVERVVDSYAFVGGAVVRGVHPVDGRYPTLAPGGSVAGRLLRTAEIRALDDYEGVDGGPYVRVSLPRADADGAVAVYVGDPVRLGVADATWPGPGSFRERVERYVREHDVTVESAD